METNTVKAITKFARMSPKKVREVARVLVGKPATFAVDMLKFTPRKSARLILKTLQSAIANAENNHNLSSASLFVDEAHVDDGPAMRRFRPAARGSAHPYKKRMSHIRIVLSTNAPAPKVKKAARNAKKQEKEATK